MLCLLGKDLRPGPGTGTHQQIEGFGRCRATQGVRSRLRRLETPLIRSRKEAGIAHAGKSPVKANQAVAGPARELPNVSPSSIRLS